MSVSRSMTPALLVLMLAAACSSLPLPGPQPTPTLRPPTPQPTPTLAPTPAPRLLKVCAGSEPADLFIYNESTPTKRFILSALYDGPIDERNSSPIPVTLVKLPSLADGDAVIEAVAVRQGDLVVDNLGNLVSLQPGALVRPSGCRSSECAVPYENGEIQMERMRVLFALRPEVLWQDGEPVKAWDSVFSYRIASDPETLYGNNGLSSGSTASLLFTRDYSALDDFTVQWTGLPGFLDPNYALNFFSPLPEHILTVYTLSDLLASNEALYQPHAWGAYQVAYWDAGQELVLEPNPFYFRLTEGLPALDRVVVRFIGQDGLANLEALRSGECDLLLPDALPAALDPAMLEMVASGAARLISAPRPVFDYLLFNLSPADPSIPPLFADLGTRQAVALCLDRNLLSDAVYAGLAPVLQFPLPGGHPLLAGASLPAFDPDPDAGKALLDEAGWLDTDGDGLRAASGIPGIPDGTPLQFTLTASDAPLRDQLGRWIAFQLQSCGMGVTVYQAPARDLLAQNAFSLLSGRTFLTAVLSAPLGIESLCAMSTSTGISSGANAWSGSNLSGYINPALDAACTAAASTLPGMPEYTTSRQEILRLLAGELPFLPLLVQPEFLMSAPGFTGFELPGGLQAFESFDLVP